MAVREKANILVGWSTSPKKLRPKKIVKGRF